MKKLDKETLALLAMLRGKIETAHAEAQSMSYDLNDILSRVRESIDDYNVALSHAAETVREYTSSMSEEWRASEASDAHAIWIDELSCATLNADEPEDVEVPNLDFPDLPKLGG